MENTSSELRVVIVTGLSGSGKSVAIRQLEDSGYYCLDNLPLDFLLPVLEKLHSRGIDRIAVAVDARGLTNSEQFTDCLAALRARKIDVRILFLTASNTELVKRFSETRAGTRSRFVPKVKADERFRKPFIWNGTSCRRLPNKLTSLIQRAFYRTHCGVGSRSLPIYRPLR